jgi:hypothetical protein
MKFTLVRPESGDWEALYIDGKLAIESHSLSSFQVLKCVKKIFGCQFENVRISDETAEMGMPELLSDLTIQN